MVAIARDIFRPNTSPMEFSSVKEGKLDLSGQLVFGSHRSGWKYALTSLEVLNNPNGVLFDGFLEDRFGWRIEEAVQRGEIPYRQPWVGVAHHPQNMPKFLDYRVSPQHVFSNYYMQESLKSCMGIFVMSEYLRNWLVEQLDVPVHMLVHPTEDTDVKFEIEKFLANSNRSIISIGQWLRKLYSIKLLPVLNYSKYWVVAESASEEMEKLERYSTNVFNDQGLESVGNFKKLDWLSNEKYDELLSQNLVFMDLYDCSASNTIVECIVRNTPLLINRHPAAVEYLGQDYPFYFENLEDAADKCQNFDLIEDTYDYLSELDKSPFTGDYFSGSIANSEIYQSLPVAYEDIAANIEIGAPVDALSDLNIVVGQPLETEYVFMVCFRNINWKLMRCIDSICSQNRNLDYGIALIDDNSDPEFNYKAVIETLQEKGVPFVFVSNNERKFLCRNLYNAGLLLCSNTGAKLIQVDGDDYLADDAVLDCVNKEYQSGAKMTFGSFYATGHEKIRQGVMNWTEPQEVNLDECWDIDLCCSWMHLKTCRRELFSEVPINYFLEKNGREWLKTGEDISVQPKMVQLSQGQARYIRNQLYVYDLSGEEHELLDSSRPRYIVENLFRLPRGSFIGECNLQARQHYQEKLIKERNLFDL